MKKNELISLLDGMSEIELKELLYNLDNDTFIKYVMNAEQQPMKKVLLLGKHNKKD